MAGSKGVRHITESRTTVSLLVAARATIALKIRASSPLALHDTLNGLVELALKSAEIEAVLRVNDTMPAPDADAIISTFLRRGSRQSAVKSGRARSGSASSKKA